MRRRGTCGLVGGDEREPAKSRPAKLGRAPPVPRPKSVPRALGQLGLDELRGYHSASVAELEVVSRLDQARPVSSR